MHHGSWVLTTGERHGNCLIEADLRGRAKRVETSVSRELCTGVVWGSSGDCRIGKGGADSLSNFRALGAGAAWRGEENW